ncbi:MAG: hypothetical protein HOC23_22955 [Halieaceae bacterium]|jgi:Ca2+-binding EF-hand superfamily protein|nr:hypothetical protein [Halieaceae bacterium]
MTKVTKRLNAAVLAGMIATAFSIQPVLAQGPGGPEGDDQQGGPKGGAKGEQRLDRSFARMDFNEDGVLSLEEMTEPALVGAEKLLSRKDKDDDDLLSPEEIQHHRRGDVGDLSAIVDDIIQCVADIKEETGNEDIVVPTADSFLSPEDKFDMLDTSGDGFIDLIELQEGGVAKATNAFDEMDTDANNEVSLEEFRAGHKSHGATKKAVRQCIRELTDDSELL